MFDLATDYEEKHNLATLEPQRRAALRTLVEKWNARNTVTNGLPALTK